MAFVVEDGTGLADSNSYASVIEADTYHAERGNGAWAARTTDDKQVALVLATDYLDKRFGGQFVGDRALDEQSLEWPRENTGRNEWDYDSTEELGPIPTNLKKACFEYADRVSATTPLAPDPVVDASGVTMVTTRLTAGPVTKTMQPIGMSGSGSVNLLRAYPGADMYLRGLVIPGGNRAIR